MKKVFYWLIITIMISCNFRTKNINQSSLTLDSTEVANSSLTFYNWYLDCLKADSTYNIVQPNYHWKDTIPILDISEYLKRLHKIGVVSDYFIKSETARFKICQDSLNTIDHKAVDSCGCSVGGFYRVCDFIDYYYWINTQEKYDGCEIKELKIGDKAATCQLRFFYDSKDSNGKHYDDNFICIVNLRKYNDKWLIDNIDKHLK
jgi:hypothetical protein